ncbi:hypothetical protein LI177_00135 [bacterium 210820-DFI.6.37]|nr:hypothetical protein [bacterium 210820-DFI.6.37]
MNKAFLIGTTASISQTDLPEGFLRLYQEALLMALKEQGVIDESQLIQCLRLL